MVKSGRVEPDSVEIVIVFDDIHRVVRNVDDAVVVVVAFLHARLSNADDFKSDSVDANGLADGGHAGKQFVARFGSEDGIKAVLQIVGVVEEAPFLEFEIPDVEHGGIEALHGKSEGTVLVLHGGIFLQHARNVTAEWNVVAQQFDVVVGEAHKHAGLVAASLLRGAAGEDAHGGGAEAFENILDGAPEAVAIGEQQNDSGNAPGHARHGEQSPAQVVAHGGNGLAQKVTVSDQNRSAQNGSRARPVAGAGIWTASEHFGVRHLVWQMFHVYSLRSASTGSSAAARRAGYRPAAMPAMASERTASAAVAGTNLGASNPGPSSTPENGAISPAAPAMPTPPLSRVRKAPSTKN